MAEATILHQRPFTYLVSIFVLRNSPHDCNTALHAARAILEQTSKQGGDQEPGSACVENLHFPTRLIVLPPLHIALERVVLALYGAGPDIKTMSGHCFVREAITLVNSGQIRRHASAASRACEYLLIARRAAERLENAVCMVGSLAVAFL